MPIFVPEPPMFGRGPIRPELGSNSSVNQFSHVVTDFDVRTKTEEYISAFAGLM